MIDDQTQMSFSPFRSSNSETIPLYRRKKNWTRPPNGINREAPLVLDADVTARLTPVTADEMADATPVGADAPELRPEPEGRPEADAMPDDAPDPEGAYELPLAANFESKVSFGPEIDAEQTYC